jgi:uncharacterized membrane protein YcaP (DUF421 family)
MPHGIWFAMFHPSVSVPEKVLRTLLVYAFLLVGLRLAGKRELGQLNAFDLVVLLLLANTVQNSIIGDDNSVTGGFVGAAVLLVVNYLVVRFLYRHQALDRMLEGDADVLVQDGKVLEKNLQRELITVGELEAAARRQGIDGLDHVQCARLEVGGALSFVERTPTDEEQRHAELLARLTMLETRIAALAAGRAPAEQ